MAQDVQSSKNIEKLPARNTDIFSELRSEVDRLFDNFVGRGLRSLPSLFPTATAPA